MKVIEITASTQVRVNTGQYEGTEYLVSMRGQLDPELDCPDEESVALQRRCDLAMLQQLMGAYRARRKKVTVEEICVRHGLVVR